MVSHELTTFNSTFILSSVRAFITVLNPQIPASTFTFDSIDESPIEKILYHTIED